MQRCGVVGEETIMAARFIVLRWFLVPSLVLFAVAVGCHSTSSVKEAGPASQPAVASEEPLAIPVQSAGPVEPQKPAAAIPARPSKLLSNVTISSSSFNPRAGQKVSVSYVLSAPANVEAALYDPDFTLVRTLKSEGVQAGGRASLAWDGKDQDGVVVPDEAYFFTITARDAQGAIETYDPTSFSGGEGKDIVKADIDPVSRAITYHLPSAARVLIRLGVQDGPLLNTLVDWKPRVAGEITEHWNGRDQDDVLDMLGQQRFKMLITCFTLPENSVITYGNREVDYRGYRKSVKAGRSVKDRPRRPEAVLSPHYQLPRTVDYSPKLTMIFADAQEKAGMPVLKGKALVKVDIGEEQKSFFVEQQYEVTFFLDTEFYTEQEVGYAPFNWVWDLTDVPAGEHLLTVNLSGFKDQIGVLSRKIMVVK